MPTPYPNAYQIEEMFASRDLPDIFNSYLADNFDATVVGQDFHIGGHYNSIKAFHDAVYGGLTATLKLETLRVEVIRVVGGGESAWAAVESVVTATSKYDKPHRNEFVDMVRFNSQGKIAYIKEFLDSGHLQGHVEEHASKTKDPE